ncbi:MAG: hypothetical protein UF228_04665 [Lachnospiraceae bacterium]|nr:hypothetical protein [Lachnospiraceae bacterium]
MKKIRKKSGCLKELRQKNKTISIGIIGTVKGCGVTNMVVAIANYLSGITGKDVGVYEYNGSRTFAKMNEYLDDVNIAKHNGCTFYPKGSVKLSSLYDNKFDFVIIDFGAERLNLNEFNRCNYKIVMGSLEPWNLNLYSESDNIINVARDNKDWSMVFNGDRKTLKKFQKEMGMNIIKRPFIDNPFIIDLSLVEFFEDLLF